MAILAIDPGTKTGGALFLHGAPVIFTLTKPDMFAIVRVVKWAKALAGTDTLEYTITFAEDHGVTPVPRGGYSLGTGFEAYHFEIASTGSSRRGAESVHEQGLYIVGPDGG